MLKVLYDLNVTSGNDEHVRNVESALAKMSAVFVPGRFAVAFFPFLRYAPAWFPGSGKQKALADCKPILWRMEHNPYIHVKNVIVSFFVLTDISPLSVHVLAEGSRSVSFCRRKANRRNVELEAGVGTRP